MAVVIKIIIIYIIAMKHFYYEVNYRIICVLVINYCKETWLIVVKRFKKVLRCHRHTFECTIQEYHARGACMNATSGVWAERGV